MNLSIIACGHSPDTGTLSDSMPGISFVYCDNTTPILLEVLFWQLAKEGPEAPFV